MSESGRVRIAQALREAEGYLELSMPAQAMAALERITQPGTFRGQVLYLRGEALRSLERYEEAIEPLVEASDLIPSKIPVWLALAWCYKRTSRLDGAVLALRKAMDFEPTQEELALLDYNLACYYSLAGQSDEALAMLAKALKLNDGYRELAHTEADFDPIRAHPEFRALTSIVV